MKPSKKKKLETAGYKVGSVDDFLGLSAAESQQVADQVGVAAALPPCMLSLRIPKGWKLEPLERLPDYALLSTPSPGSYMATVDFKHRGARTGYSTTGRYATRNGTSRARSTSAAPGGSSSSTTRSHTWPRSSR